MKEIKLKVKTLGGNYPIIIGNDLMLKIKKFLIKSSLESDKYLIVIDSKISKSFINKIKKSLSYKQTFFLLFQSSEKNKNQKSIDKIINTLFEKKFNRNDCIISVGGGITGDVVGFAASIFKRGIKFVNIPTTLLAQVDSSIGGKVGINDKKFGKNLIGSFYQPSLVITDTKFLETLPKREVICGYAEILKHSLIANKNLFKFLDRNIDKIIGLKSPYIEKTIFKSCCIKKEVVEKDEKEKNLRKILNFGHTFAHAYEASLNFSKRLNHGEAVILGMKSAIEFSHNEKLINHKEFDSAIKHLNNSHFPTSIKSYFTTKKINRIISFMMRDKKNDSKNIKLMLIKKIGGPIIEKEFSEVIIKLFLKKRLINRNL